MAQITDEFVGWYFDELARAIARKQNIIDWELMDPGDLLPKIERVAPAVYKEMKVSEKIYREWAAATRSDDVNPQKMIELIRKREDGRESLVRAVAAPTQC